MNIGEYSVRNRVISWLLVLILVGGGVWGFLNMGKLEDPAFTIKSAKVITLYPGPDGYVESLAFLIPITSKTPSSAWSRSRASR